MREAHPECGPPIGAESADQRFRLGALVRRVRRTAPDRAGLRKDVLAGLPGAIGSVPDGMAASVLAGVSPVHGLYASFAGPIAGGATTSSRLMVVTTTSAAALAAGSALAHVDPRDRAGALFLLTALAGALMVVAGLLKLGRYTRFVPHSVMIGFLSGVAVNIVAGQLPDLTGSSASGSTAVAKAIHVAVHLGDAHLASVATGAAAIVLLVALARTRWVTVGAMVALGVPSVVVLVFGLSGVVRVDHAGAIPVGIPFPQLPHLRYFTTSLLTGAFAVAALVLVQGAGVAEAAPNPGGEPPDPNRDFAAQGIANFASALFQGQPVGGSVGQTALNRVAGAGTRWAAIASGVWMIVILVALSSVVARVAMPTLAAVLIVAALGSLRPAEVLAIFRTSSTSRVALVSTFLATLFLPVAAAVGIGVTVSLLLQLNRDAVDLRVVRLDPQPDGTLVEATVEQDLASGRVTVLDVYGSLLYAGARTLQARLPDPSGSSRPVVVLRMRGRTTLGSTFFSVLAAYAEEVAARGGRLYVSGVDRVLLDQMRRNGQVEVDGSVAVFAAEPAVGSSTLAAVRDGHLWLIAGDELGEP